MSPETSPPRRGRRKISSLKAPLSEEDFDARVAETAALFAAAANPDVEDQSQAHSASVARTEEQVSRAISGYLRDELTIVSRLDGPDGIDPQEKERQIVRRALSRLSKAELQTALIALGLPKSGTKEVLLDRLMLETGGSRTRVSALLDSIDRHPRRGRRHAAWLFVFEDLSSGISLSQLLPRYTERYVRTDVAKWFLLKTVAGGSDLVIDGSVRTYDVSLDADLSADQHDFPVHMVMHGGESLLRVESRGRPEALSAIEAISFLIQEAPLPPLAKIARTVPSWGSAGGLRLQTTWILGVLLGLLDHETMELQDVTSVLFERAARGPGTPHSARTPLVGSAQLRGQHVLDSQSACQHIKSGEVLRGVSGMVRFAVDDAPDATLPIRLTVDRDCITVMTGFGGKSPAATAAFQRRLEDYIALQAIQSNFDSDRLETTVAEMERRADDANPPAEADLFVNARHAEIRVDG